MTTPITVRGAAALAGLTMLGAALAPATANAQSTATVCGMGLSTVTPGGDDKQLSVKATTPPTSGTFMGPKGLYPDVKPRLAGAVGSEPVVPAGLQVGGYVVLGTDMYGTSYTTDGSGTEVTPGSFGMTKIGGGWGADYTYFEKSTYTEGFTYLRYRTYALQNTGRLTRWTSDAKGWHSKQTTTALPAGIKTMTLISQQRTYETFLANTTSGALYSIRVPIAGTMTPVVKLIRSSGWQSFETLVADKCGTQSTLLLGIDKDSKTGKLYAVSHANGTATVIQDLGKVTGTFDDPYYARKFWDVPESGNLNGE